MKTKIVKGYNHYNSTDLIERANHHINSLTNNEHYPDAGDLLNEVKIAIEALEASLKISYYGSAEDVKLQRSENRAMLLDKLDLVYNYVVYKGGNDVNILTSSGFLLIKESAKPKGNSQPKNFKVTGGDEAGTMLMQCRGVPGSEGYFFQYKQMPDADMSEWHTVQNTSNCLLITKLTSGAKYSFRMAAVGPTVGKGEWSETITRFVP